MKVATYAPIFAIRSNDRPTQVRSEGIAHMYRNIPMRYGNKRSWVQHLRTKPGEACSLGIGKPGQETSIHDDTWVSRHDAIHIGIDRHFDAIECRTNHSGRIIRTIATKCRHHT